MGVYKQKPSLTQIQNSSTRNEKHVHKIQTCNTESMEMSPIYLALRVTSLIPGVIWKSRNEDANLYISEFPAFEMSFFFSFLFSSQFIFFCKVIQIPETSNIQSQIFLHLQSHLFCLNFLVTFGWMQSQSNCAKCTQFMPKNIYTDYSKKTVFISENAIHFLQNFLFYWAFIKHFLKSNWC